MPHLAFSFFQHHCFYIQYALTKLPSWHSNIFLTISPAAHSFLSWPSMISVSYMSYQNSKSLFFFDLQFPGTHSISKYATTNIISLDFTLPNLSSLHIEYVCKFSDPHYFPTCSHACTQPRENHNTNILIFPLQFLLFLIC